MKCSGAPCSRAALRPAPATSAPSNSAPVAIALLDQLGALVEDPAGAERVVADLAVAHVVVARHADRRAVRAQLGRRAAACETIEGRRAREPDRVALVALRRCPTPSITQTTTGPGTPANPSSLRSVQSVMRPPCS